MIPLFLLYVMLFPITPAIFLDEGQQDVGSPLRVAQCRATCLERFSNDALRGESVCLQGPDCFMCWENCELLQSNFQVWGVMCHEREICFPGCQEACRFHNEVATKTQQSQPVIYTKGEAVIRVNGAVARWPRPVTLDPTTPLVYVVMRRSRSGPWRQIIQTLDLTTRVPFGTDDDDSILRILVVDSKGLLTIYSPYKNKLNNKIGKTINTEIKSIQNENELYGLKNEKWQVQEISLIHQKVLVIAEISWAPKSSRGVYLVTWEINGGGLKGNLFTDSTCVTLSLWPKTIYHIQVELVSHYPGMANLKSEMLDLDTSKAQQVSTEPDKDSIKLIPSDDIISVELNDFEHKTAMDDETYSEFVRSEENIDWVRPRMEILSGFATAMIFFLLVLIILIIRWRIISRQSGKIYEDASFSRDSIINVTPTTAMETSVTSPTPFSSNADIKV